MHKIERVGLVTQTFPPRVGGMEAVMLSIAEHFSLIGTEVLVFPDRAAPISTYYRSHLLSTPKLFRHLVKRALVSKICRDTDLIICDSWKSVKAVPKDLSNIVVLAHGQEFLNTNKHMAEITEALGRASAVVCSSSATESLVKHFSPPSSIKTSVIYPTYMLASAASDPSVTTNRIPQLTSISRLERRKGIQNAMHALADLKSQGFEFHWKICGSGAALDDLLSLRTELNLETEVSFPGRVTDEQKHKILSSTDLFVMPSYREGNSLEGFGISYVEAASYGIPSIGGEAGGASEAVNAPECGWTCDGGDPSSIYVAIHEALSNPESRLKRGGAAKANFEQKFRGDRAFQTFLSVCRTI